MAGPAGPGGTSPAGAERAAVTPTAADRKRVSRWPALTRLGPLGQSARPGLTSKAAKIERGQGGQ